MRSRWDTSKRVDGNGAQIPVLFTANDLDMCKLLCPVQGVRTPWSYQYLPTGYLAPLLGREAQYISNRAQELVCEPYNYLAQPDQPQTNFRDIIYSIGANGVDELREHNAEIPRRSLRPLAHELMASIVAASFEYGSITQGVSIEVVKENHAFYPDWPVFWVTTPFQQKRVYLEVDRGTEQLESHPTNTTIDDKLSQYLSLGPALKDALVVFVTIRRTRADTMIERLKKAIDKAGVPHGYARSFAFTHIPYDRFLTKVPKLTDWAVTADYQRAGAAGPFNFMREGK
jgi:hypothetical protein